MPRTMKAKDSFPSLRIVLSDANGPVDLSSAAGSIKVFIQPEGESLITLTAAKVMPQTGDDLGAITADFTITTFTVTTLGALPANDIPVEVQVHWDAGNTQRTTFPASGYESLSIEADLGD